MPRFPIDPLAPPPPPAPPTPTSAADAPDADVSREGLLDLDDEDQINNQHLEVR